MSISQLYGGPSLIGRSVDILIGADGTIPVQAQLMPIPTDGSQFEQAVFSMAVLVAGGTTPMLVKQGGADVTAANNGTCFNLVGSIALASFWRVDVNGPQTAFVSILWPGGAQSKIRFTRIDKVDGDTTPEPPIIVI